MTSTIKIDDQTKNRFDKLQAKILLETGKKLSQQQLLDLLLIQAEKTEEELYAEISSINHPFSKEQREKILSLQFDLEYDTSKEEEDQIIYEE